MEKKITLVVVDFQYDFCLLGAPLYVPGSDRALWNISHLIENKKIGEVIFTADWLKWGLSDEDVEQAIHILNDTNTTAEAHL